MISLDGVVTSLMIGVISDIAAVFVLKRNVKLQLTN